MADNALLWFHRGHLHKIIGVRPCATRVELKEACRRARLRSHPDKPGGDQHLFRIVEDTVQLLLNNLPSFDGVLPMPLILLREEIERCRRKFDTGIGGSVIQLQYLRGRYADEYQIHMDKRQALEQKLKEEQSLQERIAKIQQGALERSRRDNLMKRCYRKPPNRFPTLPVGPDGPVKAHFLQLRTKYANLAQRKREQEKRERDVQALDGEMVQILTEARAIAKTEIEKECQQRHLFESFPSITRKHPKFDMVVPLKRPYLKLRDAARKCPRKNHQAQAQLILRQAWDLVRS